MKYEEALNQNIKLSPIQARNDLERYLLRDEKPIPKAVAMGMQALEKQIPKKPIKSEKFLKSKHTVKVAVCPNCNSSLGLCNYAKTTFKFCGDCGQALDWSDT